MCPCILYGLLVLLFIRTSQSEEISKACYGTKGLSCTIHTLECNNGTIRISEAYYANDTECPAVGLSSCALNFSNITEIKRLAAFNAVEREKLNKNCSSTSSCTYTAGSRGFSVVKYQCLNDALSTISQSPVDGHVSETTQYSKATDHRIDVSLGTSVGAPVASVLIIATGVLLIVIIQRKRNKQMRKRENKEVTLKDFKSPKNTSLGNGIPENKFRELQEQPSEDIEVDEDYATIEGVVVMVDDDYATIRC